MARGATVRSSPKKISEQFAVVRAWLPKIMLGLIVLVGGFVLHGVYTRYHSSTAWQVQHVRIDGNLRQLRNDELLRALALSNNATVLNVDLQAMTDRLQALPWVKTASVRRVYPSQLVVSVTEREPWLRLNTQQLVDREGVAFMPANVDAFVQLPQIIASDDHLPLALIQYTVALESLRPLGLQPVVVELSSRRALTLTLNNQLRLLFGRDDWDARIKRVASLYPELLAEGHLPSVIDVRYDTGLAVTWAADKHTATARTAGL